MSDGNGGKDTATATINVTGTNDTPIGKADSYTVNEDNTLTVQANAGVLANDKDPDHDALTAVLVTGPAHGTVTLNADGSFSYVPTTNYNGEDSFSYKPNDGITNGAPVVVKITVGSVLDQVFTNNGETVNLHNFAADQTMTSPNNPYFEDGNYLNAKEFAALLKAASSNVHDGDADDREECREYDRHVPRCFGPDAQRQRWLG